MVYVRLVLDLLWCVVSDLCLIWYLVSDVEYLVTDLICCLVSTCWSGVVCGAWSGILPGGQYLIWCLVIKSNLVSGIWLGGWSWCLVLVSGLVSGCWFWSGMHYLLFLIWCVMSV